ncbi:MAG: ROK family protein [Paracoccus sp. (in: a-proteobacteria)]|uniref:ROK family transcriptional regulator n=1 Tax=Paracoccus sp. TaxID=267 RepID=UPI00391D20AB
MNQSSLPRIAIPSVAVAGPGNLTDRSELDRLLLSLIRRHGALAKSELARLADLSPQTVSVTTRALEKQGLLRRLEPLRGRIGQPMVPLALAPEGAFVAGVKIGRRSVDYLLADFCGGVRAQSSLEYDAPDPAIVLTWLRRQLGRTRADLGLHAAKLIGLGIAMPFQLWDWQAEEPAEQAHHRAWQAIDLRAALADEGLSISLVNDATAACAAEMMFGTASLPVDFVYFYIGTFIGGGVVQNGRLRIGPTGHGGALGSMLVQCPDAGTVQLIRVASLAALKQSLQAAGIAPPCVEDDPEGWASLCDHVQPWIDRAAFGIAQAAISAIAVTDSKAVVIDGAIPDALRQSLVAKTLAHMQALDMSGIVAPEVKQGTLGVIARSLGAAGTSLITQFGLRADADFDRGNRQGPVDR